ncbi:MAG: nucleotide sugar dehydrogenase [Myxococcota bacterium]
MNVLDRLRKHEARVTVLGAGYVGLPLAVEIARAGFDVTAFDTDGEKVRRIEAGQSYIKDIDGAEVAREVAAKRLHATSDAAVLGQSDAVVICVPTPLNKTKDPDISLILDATETVAKHLHRGQLVVLESTTYPGFTREVMLPRLSQSGLRVGEDFFLAFSPERVDPGNEVWRVRNTPKVIGGTTEPCQRAAAALYGAFIDTIVPVSSTDAAEMVKLLENTFRAVNIGLVNEIAIMCRRLGLGTWEVIDAAATKPFGFMPFYPGPGLGGHCIPVDPQYLSWKLKTLKYHARFIEMAGEINSGMPQVVVQLVADALNDTRKALRGSRVLVIGVAYKRDIEDVRESPALDVLEFLHARGAEIAYHDPYVPELRLGPLALRSEPLDALASWDCVVVVTNHSNIDYRRILAEAPLVLDTRNATKGLRDGARARVVCL